MKTVSATTATATPRTDAMETTCIPREPMGMAATLIVDAVNLSRALERELAAMAAENETLKQVFDLNMGYAKERAEKAEAENADLTKRLGLAHAALEQETNAHEDADLKVITLLALLERCRPVLVKVFNVRLSEVKDTLPTPLQEAASKLIGEIDAARGTK